MRLFLAVRLPPDVVEHLDRAMQAARALAPPEVRWADPARWHLTLAFYGEVPDDRVDRLRNKITRQVRGARTLDLQLRAAGRFGDRVLWVGVGGRDRDELRRLGTAVSVEDRPYRPHLTVARVRGSADLRPLVADLGDYEGPGWTATQLVLVRSRLGPRPAYDDIASWPLAPRPGA
ncbi:MAG: 2,3-cyclic 3-phosphodiesterase [Actinomycetota bacterium]|jgi:2'-5' RNA ligase|nr:2,3-cyclic 3-phosphodiesterase [Actinomycetota bacterium]